MPTRERSRLRSSVGVEQVLAVEQHLALGALAGIEVVHAVEHAQQRRLAAARGADEGRHLAELQRQRHRLQRLRAAGAVIEIEVRTTILSRSAAPGAALRLAAVDDAMFMTLRTSNVAVIERRAWARRARARGCSRSAPPR